MGGTRIIVLQLKHIIRSAIFLVVTLAVIGLLIFMFMQKKDSSSAIYHPGDYSSKIILHSKPVNVLVTVDTNKILAIKLDDINESQEVFYPLFKPAMEMLAKEIIEYQSTDIPTINDYAITGRILLTAVDNALEQARR